jgi:hypothetical protein
VLQESLQRLSAKPRHQQVRLSVDHVSLKSHRALTGAGKNRATPNNYCTLTSKCILGWMPHSTVKCPAMENTTSVLLPGSWSPESKLKLSDDT